MTYTVSGGTLNPAHSLTNFIFTDVIRHVMCEQFCMVMVIGNT